MALFICQGCGAEHQSWGGKCPHCGTSETIRLAPSTDRMVDRVIKGKFKIVRKLGQGGMGAVYLAEQLGIGHRVALKFLKSEFSTDAEIARRFLNEAKSYARVAHPNAVALHDFGQDDEGNLFIAMEYCEGVDLKKIIAEQGRLPMIEAIEIVLQVADVLANAHEKGVIHRDLKPENIMIRRGIRGVHAKVLDFGIARLMDAGTKLTVAGAIAGTPRYMSPEQVEGKEVDLRADIYSLGICLFEALTGQQPFDGTTITEILRKQALDPLPTLVSFSGDLDYPQLEAVLQRACAKKRDDRWPDMVAFASALSQAIPTQAHLALPPLQRTNVTARPMATPAPGQITTSGSETETGSTDRTVIRTEPGVQAVERKPLQLNQPLNTSAGMPVGQVSLDHARPGNATQAADASIPPTPPRSNAPFIAIGIGVLVIGAAVFALTRPPADVPKDPVKDPIVKNDPPPKVDPPADPPKNDPPKVDPTIEMNARLTLGNGQTAFEVAKLDEAETYLKAVIKLAPDGDSGKEATALLEKIDTIRTRLKSAGQFRAAGNCSRALDDYKAVLALNGKLKDALDGVAACKAGLVPSTME
ncbi:MAG: protein kinase [Myxococcaceae bacterium]